jgi:hypothetical protein
MIVYSVMGRDDPYLSIVVAYLLFDPIMHYPSVNATLWVIELRNFGGIWSDAN